MKSFAVRTNGSKAQQAFLNEYIEGKGFRLYEGSLGNYKEYPYFIYNGNDDIFDHHSESHMKRHENGIDIVDVLTFMQRVDMLEQPIVVAGYKVEFKKGSIKVGCSEIQNDMVRKITNKLID